MSTKAIREALTYVYQTGTAEQVTRAQKAMAEVEAIERAARVICDKGRIIVPSGKGADAIHVGEAELLLIEIADRHEP